MVHTLVSGQKWKDLPGCGCKGGTEFTIGTCGPFGTCGGCGEGCGTNKDTCACICAPSICLCGTVSPCCVDKDNQCYVYWIGDAVMSLQLYDEGKKMKLEFCFIPCGEYEKVAEAPSAPQGGAPGSTEMKR